MPIYDYECKKCKRIFEKWSTEKNIKCPYCNSKQIKKIISMTSFQLKGDGWFKDGYTKPIKKKES